jgi:hypothetical protein
MLIPNASAKVKVMFNYGETAFQVRHTGSDREISFDSSIVLTNLLRDLGSLPVDNYRAASTVCFIVLGILCFCAIPAGIFHNLPAFIVLGALAVLLLIAVAVQGIQFVKFKMHVREVARKYALERPKVTLVFGCGVLKFVRLACCTRDHNFCCLSVDLAPVTSIPTVTPALRVSVAPPHQELLPISFATPDAHETSLSNSLDWSWAPARTRIAELRYASETRANTDLRTVSTRTDFGGEVVSSIADVSKHLPMVPNPNTPFPPKPIPTKQSSLSFESVMQASPSHVLIAEH